ncbi:MAG: RDD family protein [Gammaproteobacteria bacterium]
MPNKIALSAVPLWRQMLAAVYDLMLVFALWWLAAALVTLMLGKGAEPNSASSYLIFLLGVSLQMAYFCISWRYSGQTIGQRAWGFRISSRSQGAVTGYQCLMRFFVASLCLVVLGWLYGLISPERLSLQDWLSKTQLVRHR